jgi:peptidoglycan-associated lipoprotein
MRRNVSLLAVLIMMLSVIFFTASCSDKVVKTQTESMTEPETQKAPDISAEETEQDEQIMEQLKAEAAAREEPETVFDNEPVHFAFDSASLSDQARQSLNDMADYLHSNPDKTIIVEGHCDNRGTDAYNIALGERRAESVKVYLSGLGIDTRRLETISYGEERPIAVGNDETSWAENRRAQFVIN